MFVFSTSELHCDTTVRNRSMDAVKSPSSRSFCAVKRRDSVMKLMSSIRCFSGFSDGCLESRAGERRR
eukprot:scaffold248000_cov23-Cyclotella_meneghiniana.AAC.1